MATGKHPVIDAFCGIGLVFFTLNAVFHGHVWASVFWAVVLSYWIACRIVEAVQEDERSRRQREP